MKEENVREWGIIHPLGLVAVTNTRPTITESSPTPENLTYHFASTFTLRAPDEPVPAHMALVPLTPRFEYIEPTAEAPSQALTLNYGHPRFIEYPEEEIVIQRSSRPVFSILVATVSIFTICYVYYLTELKLKWQAEKTQYLATISQEQETKAKLLSPHIKVLSFQELGRSTVTAKLFWDTNNQTIQLFLAKLPTAAPGESFQLWYFTKEAKFIPVTTFSAAAGEAAINVKIPREYLTQIERIIVSVEPPGKYPFPVGKILLRGLLR